MRTAFSIFAPIKKRLQFAHARTHKRTTHTRTHPTRTHTHIYIYIYIYIYINVHTHTHTRTHTTDTHDVLMMMFSLCFLLLSLSFEFCGRPVYVHQPYNLGLKIKKFIMNRESDDRKSPFNYCTLIYLGICFHPRSTLLQMPTTPRSLLL